MRIVQIYACVTLCFLLKQLPLMVQFSYQKGSKILSAEEPFEVSR